MLFPLRHEAERDSAGSVYESAHEIVAVRSSLRGFSAECTGYLDVYVRVALVCG